MSKFVDLLLYSAGDITQGFAHARQVFYRPLSYVHSLLRQYLTEQLIVDLNP